MLATALKSVARHEVRVDDHHLQRMRKICANYDPDETGFRSKSRERLKNFEDERRLGALLHLPDRLLDEAGRPRTSRRQARLLAQVAVAIDIELVAPGRLSNLVSLNLQKNIQAIGVGRQTRWLVSFDRHETKNRARLFYEIPVEIVERIGRAFKFYEQTNGWLFPGAKGTSKRPTTLGMQVKRVIERRLGVPFNVHLFRAISGEIQTKESPDGGIQRTMALLGDRDERIVRDRYAHNADRHLIAKAQETIQKVRVRTAASISSRLRAG